MRSILVALLALAAGPALAQTPAARPAPACTAAPVALPRELAGWTQQDKQTAAASLIAADSATLNLGRRADVALLPIASVSLPVASTRTPAAGTHGGLLGFAVAEAGTYRVALDQDAWIEVLRDMKALPSTGHGHRAPCSGIRKMVDFALAPGRYILEVSGNPAPQLAVMVARVR